MQPDCKRCPNIPPAPQWSNQASRKGVHCRYISKLKLFNILTFYTLVTPRRCKVFRDTLTVLAVYLLLQMALGIITLILTHQPGSSNSDAGTRNGKYVIPTH
jgi:hypothetical protein